MKLGWQPKKWLAKKSKLGFRGYPVGTIALYGPDNRIATKAAVGIVLSAHSEPAELRRWITGGGDVRADETIIAELVEFLREHGAHSVTMTSGTIGCPHEEGIDYPEGATCPACPYWAGRDRWTGKLGGN